VSLCVAPGESGKSLEESAKMVMDVMLEKLPEVYDMEAIRAKVEEVTPYVMVAIQVGAWGDCRGTSVCVSVSMRRHGSSSAASVLHA
jgi:hypothetical protein